MRRPEYVHCAQMGLWDGSVPLSKTWCGRVDTPKDEWQFESANHALLSGRSRSMLCPECATAIKEALRAVAYRPRRKSA